MGPDQWRPDVLGPGFERLTLPPAPDAEGEVVATLVRYAPGPHPVRTWPASVPAG